MQNPLDGKKPGKIKMPSSGIWVARQRGGLCNNLKCLLSTVRLAAKDAADLKTTCADLCSIYDGLEYIDEKQITSTMNTHRDWRLLVFKEDPLEPGFSKRRESQGFSDADPENRNIDHEFHRIPLQMRRIYLTVLQQFSVRQDIQNSIEEFAEEWITANTITVHMRTWLTDHWDQAPKRHARYFNIKYYENLIERHDKLFISCDNEIFLKQLIDRFGSRILYYKDAGKFKHSQVAYINLALLAKGHTLIGSSLSTFTEMAWWIGGCRAKVELVGPNK